MALRLTTKLVFATSFIALAAVGIGTAARMMTSVPADVDFSRTRTSEHGLYLATLETGSAPLTIGNMTAFVVTLRDRQGKPVENAEIAVDGGMPQHGHGLPTQPRMTAELGAGRYRIDGVKFNMPGWWTFAVHARAKSGADDTTFNLKL